MCPSALSQALQYSPSSSSSRRQFSTSSGRSPWYDASTSFAYSESVSVNEEPAQGFFAALLSQLIHYQGMLAGILPTSQLSPSMNQEPP